MSRYFHKKYAPPPCGMAGIVYDSQLTKTSSLKIRTTARSKDFPTFADRKKSRYIRLYFERHQRIYISTNQYR